MKRKMGTFYTECTVVNNSRRDWKAEAEKVLVDTGSELTWIAEQTMKRIGISPEKSGVLFETADGRTVSRDVGFALVLVAGRFTIDEVVFARPGDLQILGARTLEGLNLAVDPARKRLVAAGPLPAAALA
ncbi:MAG: aspartyl protease family protein [Elusimicrobiota bacterium]